MRVSIAFRLGVRPPQCSCVQYLSWHHAVSIAFRLGVRPPRRNYKPVPNQPQLVSIAFRLGVRPPQDWEWVCPCDSVVTSPLPFGWGCGRPYRTANKCCPCSDGLHCLSAGGAAAP